MDKFLASICPAYTWQRSRQFIGMLQYTLLSAWRMSKSIKTFFAAFLFLSSVLPAGFIQLKAQPYDVVHGFEQQLFGNTLKADLYANLDTKAISMASLIPHCLPSVYPPHFYLRNSAPNGLKQLRKGNWNRENNPEWNSSVHATRSIDAEEQASIVLSSKPEISLAMPLALAYAEAPQGGNGLSTDTSSKQAFTNISRYANAKTLPLDERILDKPSPYKISSSELHLAAKVLLQGAYRKNQGMRPGLLQFLYAFEAASMATPDSSVGRMIAGYSVPDNAIDVIKIEIRPFADKVHTVASRYAWLLADGSIRDFETGQQPFLSFTHQVSSDEFYHVVVKHRNHLTLMSSSASPVKLVPDVPGRSAGEGYIDFTDINNIYGPGAVLLGRDGYGMVAGNARNTDQEINGNDFYDVSLDSDTPVDTGYKLTDYTLDGKCNATDYQLASEASDRLFYSTAINP